MTVACPTPSSSSTDHPACRDYSTERAGVRGRANRTVSAQKVVRDPVEATRAGRGSGLGDLAAAQHPLVGRKLAPLMKTSEKLCRLKANCHSGTARGPGPEAVDTGSLPLFLKDRVHGTGLAVSPAFRFRTSRFVRLCESETADGDCDL